MNVFRKLRAINNTDIESEGIPRVYFHSNFLNGYFAFGMTLFSETLEDRWKKAESISELRILLIFKRAVSNEHVSSSCFEQF